MSRHVASLAVACHRASVGGSRWRAALAMIACQVVAFAQQQVAPPTIQMPTLPEPPARLPIYYPPIPPAPETAIDRVAARSALGWDAPTGLAAYLGEPFYAPLRTLLAEDTLGRKLRARLQDYANRRQRLRDSLRNVAGPSDDALTALKRLDEDAETLRRDLCDTGADIQWGALRRWNLKVSAHEVSPAQQQQREAQVLLAAAFYDDGLSTAQRTLLNEITMEPGQPGVSFTDLAETRVEPRAVIFFLPNSARIRLPASLSGELAHAVTEFVREKTRLKRELAHEIIDHDGEGFHTTRRRRFQDLARREAPAFAALEEQAEHIRRLLAAVPPEPTPQFPAGVTQMAREYLRARRQLQGELVARLQRVRTSELTYKSGSEILMWRANFSPGAYVSAPTRPMEPLAAFAVETPLQHQRWAAIRQHLEAVFRDYATDTAAKQAELARKREDLLAAVIHDVKAPEGRAALTAREAGLLLHEFEVHERASERTQFDELVTKPGLHSSVRKLLFDEAWEKLNPPLPVAIRRPVGINDD